MKKFLRGESKRARWSGREQKRARARERFNFQTVISRNLFISSIMALMERIPYASAIRSIMYAMICTRPDVACALSVTSRFQAYLGEKHWEAMKCILKYLRRTKDLFLVYGEDELKLKGNTDLSFQ